jgi:hypothetical protein
MKERFDRRVLGAIRWIDAVSQAPIPLPLVATSEQMRFVRNLSGLTVVTHADGLENYEAVFDLAQLPPGQVVALGTLERSGQVEDPSGVFLPRKFTLKLPRDPSPALLPPDNHRPADSLFTPVEIALLPAPAARLSPGCAEVRVLVLDDEGAPIPNALARVVATADDTILGCGLADARGEALVAVPGLKHFAPGATEEEVVTVETEARLEIIHPPAGEEVVDWTVLRDAAVAAGDTDDELLQLRPGGLYSRRYPFTA